jgi:hypothetical protein
MHVIAGLLAIASSIAPTAAPRAKLRGHGWEPTPTMIAAATGASGEVVWLEDQMCFCEVPRIPPVRDGYRMPFGLARRVHGDFRGRVVNSVEGAL